MIPSFDRVAALRREGQSFAVATVVARRSPVSAHLGDRAIVFPDGRMEGFVGGACSCEIVRREALEAIRTRRARLVSIRPDAEDHTAISAEHIVVMMRCASEGAVDVFVEPMVQVRRLVVAGATPVADALVRVGRSLDYEVVWAVAGQDRHDIEPRAATLGASVTTIDEIESVLRIGGADVAAVVATQGHDDDRALEAILRCGASYVGLLASRKRGAAIRAALDDRGVPGVAAVRTPAGLDLGARVPAEVALSVLAEIVKESPTQSPTHGTTCGADTTAGAPPVDDAAAAADTPVPAAAGQAVERRTESQAVDPVCGMTVDPATARHSADVGGIRYYFCCPHCRADFVAAPDQYLAPHT
jgi:xanthine dehydrogenase accessory factor